MNDRFKPYMEIIDRANQNGAIIAGGFPRYLKTGQPFSDIDIYVKNINDLQEFNSFNWRTAKYGIKEGYFGCITHDLNVRLYPWSPKIKVQLIYKELEEFNIESIFKDFDLTCCQIGLDNYKDLKYTPEFERDVRNNEIVFNTIREINRYRDFDYLIKRFIKYIYKGYNIKLNEYLKFIIKIKEGLENIFLNMSYKELNEYFETPETLKNESFRKCFNFVKLMK